MLRSVLISLSKAAWARKLVTHWKFAKKMASRFIAGETLTEAIAVVRQLNSAGMVATLDQLGENTQSPAEAESAARSILNIYKEINANQLRCNVSVKLSQVGLTIGEQLCRDNLKLILEKARETGNFLRIDMEDSGLTEKTINMYMWAREAGYANVGIVIQSYLYRSEKDIELMNKFDTRVRLCKGAYKEPESVTFPKKSQVDENFDILVSLLFSNSQRHGFPLISSDGRTPPIPALATHDPKRIEYAIQEARVRNTTVGAFEFQMLYGIRRDLQEDLVKQGYPVRIYVPFGTHWYPYFMRRLAERPANLWFFASNFFRK